ncbi:Radical SAM domain protein [Syntrophobacter sp. SbD1]|nr:Radical SAM domain protein [Syntrophobacter sp. SbD1]
MQSLKSKKTPDCFSWMLTEKMIYPIFLPHAGCPFQCVYCNQRVVASYAHSESDILEYVESGLRDYSSQVHKSGRAGEIAFFSGTFTALPPALIESILAFVSIAVKQGIFTTVRFSTRPDCLDDDVMDLLSKYPIGTVELGVQSLSDHVLQKSGRGYSASSVYSAAKRVRDRGWKLGFQLMAGLPGDTRELFIESMRKTIEIQPDFVRIHPTLVLEGTALAESFREGIYAPLSLDEAVDWLAPAYDLATTAGISVIRMGLQSDPALEKPGVIVAGPYHPAFGYLVKCRSWRDRIDRHFASLSEISGAEMVLLVSPNQVSDVIGHRKSNLLHWKARWGVSVKVAGDAGLKAVDFLFSYKDAKTKEKAALSTRIRTVKSE